jgi:phage FluMu gp28-like protein
MLWDKSRRIGATYADSYKSVRLRNKIDHRRDLWFSSADESAAIEYALYCKQWGDIFKAAVKEILEELEDDKGYKFNNYVCEFPNGSRINCMSSNPRRFRSKGGDVVLDEFDWHDNPGEMLDAAMPATTWGYDLRILTTRNGEGSEFDKLVKKAKKIINGDLDPKKDPVLPWSYHYIPITIAIEQGLAEKIYRLDSVDPEARARLLRECRARSRNDDAFNQEYMCIPSAAASTLIPYDLYQSCEDPGCLDTIGGGDKFLGFDVGREHHRTKFWLLEEVGDVLVTRKVITLHKAPYSVQLKVASDLLADRTIRRACGDATGIGDMLVETLQEKYGEHRVEKIKFTANSKDHMASLVLGRFEDKRIRVPDDVKIRDSFHSVRKTVTAAGNIRYDAVATDEGHADDFWSLGCALEAAWQPEPVPQIFIL